ncbi:MAG: nicotinate-nucleotide--dimethylbenzimidazole phosphoribosyltransferase [Candidatus Latescibacterota bacterium]|nr:MAG: nicotinate-nucleotide--dimethylbenzimidazole phosphoribosyltransferase [Candidatus Latescibacterota bacterium]
MPKWREAVGSISSLDLRAMEKARRRQERLTKPPGSLGRLEEISVQVAGITCDPLPEVRDKVIFTVAGDHGVADEGVSAYPKEVTAQMVANFLRGGAAINVLARCAGARVIVVDAGVAAELPSHPDLRNFKLGYGTKNIARGPAMTRQQAEMALDFGIKLVEEERKEGLDILGLGDMGIANTTPSAAVASVFTGLPSESVAGRGTGIDDATFSHKVEVIRRALDLNRPDPSDPVDVLAKVGGFEIGVLAGITLGGAFYRIPVVLDGLIATAGALIAYRLCPQVRDYCIAAHLSVEVGHRAMLEHMGLAPLLDLGLRLGEGTGAALGIFLVEASVKVLREMATFEEAGVSERSS